MRWIVIPTYNERYNITNLVAEIFAVLPTVKVLVVDDNSPDGTADGVRTSQRIFPNLYIHVRDAKAGLGSAYIHAFRWLLASESFETLSTMDADFSHSPRYLPLMYDLARKYDLVIGSRYVSGGGTVGWPVRRRMLSRAGNIYARLATHLPVKDMTAGFMTFRRPTLEKMDLGRIHCNGYAFAMEVKCAAILAGATRCRNADHLH